MVQEIGTVTTTGVIDAILHRRSIGKVTDQVPGRDVIEQILEAGTWAPNHHLTEPWRFFVLEGDARSRLGELMGRIAANNETDPELAEAIASRTATKPLRAPVVIAVGCEPAPESTSPLIEEVSAVSAAAQNMLLAAEACGLAAIWRSGWIAFTPELRDFFGLSERGTLVGFIYLGYSAMERPTRTRQPVSAVTQWWT